jgi:type IV fimbrial biogenesis protein FimT
MQRSRGFTLIELVVTLTVAGILTALAIPSFKTTIQNNRLITESNDLLAALLYARSQAIGGGSTSSTYVHVCAANSSTSPTGCSASSSDWGNGWLVMGYPTAPSAAPGSATNLSAASTTPTVMRVFAALPSGTSLDANAYGSNINFASNGTLQSSITGSTAYFILCDSRGVKYARAIYLGTSGEARVATTPGKLLNGSTAITSCTQ